MLDDETPTPTESTPEASARNRATLAAALPALAAKVEAASPSQTRMAVRATTPDRLPVAGPLAAPGLYALTGLGSRGFCVAPLLGEHLAARILNQPSPLPLAAERRLSPTRFANG